MKSPRDKLHHNIDSLEASMASLAKERLSDKRLLAQKLDSYAYELMKDANTEDQQFVLAQIDRLRVKYGLPHVGTT